MQSVKPHVLSRSRSVRGRWSRLPAQSASVATIAWRRRGTGRANSTARLRRTYPESTDRRSLLRGLAMLGSCPQIMVLFPHPILWPFNCSDESLNCVPAPERLLSPGVRTFLAPPCVDNPLRVFVRMPCFHERKTSKSNSSVSTEFYHTTLDFLRRPRTPRSRSSSGPHIRWRNRIGR